MTDQIPQPMAPSEIYFAASTGAFYDTSLWTGELPVDAVLIEREAYDAQLAAEASGLHRSAAEDGRPAAVEPPPPSTEALAAQARLLRDREIDGIQWLVERHRGEQALGLTRTLTDEDFLLVLRYAQDLRDVPEQDGFPEVIDWPQLPPEILATGA